MLSLHINRLTKALIYRIDCRKDVVWNHRCHKVVAFHLLSQNLWGELRPRGVVKSRHFEHHCVTTHWVWRVIFIRFWLVDEAFTIWIILFVPGLVERLCVALGLPHWNLSFVIEIEAFVLETISGAAVYDAQVKDVSVVLEKLSFVKVINIVIFLNKSAELETPIFYTYIAWAWSSLQRGNQSLDVVIGIRTQGYRMIGAEGSSGPWPSLHFCLRTVSHKNIYCVIAETNVIFHRGSIVAIQLRNK